LFYMQVILSLLYDHLKHVFMHSGV